MSTIQGPPAGSIGTIRKRQDGAVEIIVTQAWFHWFNVLAMDQQANVADAETSHAVTSFEETDAALDALGTKINSIFDILEAIKAMAES